MRSLLLKTYPDGWSIFYPLEFGLAVSSETVAAFWNFVSFTWLLLSRPDEDVSISKKDIVLRLLPEGPIVQGAEKVVFVRCLLLLFVVIPPSKQFGHFPSFR